MEKAYNAIMMVLIMKDSGKMICKMVRVDLLANREIFMKVHGKIICKRVKGRWNNRMVKFIMDCGKMI